MLRQAKSVNRVVLLWDVLRAGVKRMVVGLGGPLSLRFTSRKRVGPCAPALSEQKAKEGAGHQALRAQRPHESCRVGYRLKYRLRDRKVNRLAPPTLTVRDRYRLRWEGGLGISWGRGEVRDEAWPRTIVFQPERRLPPADV